MQTHRPVTLIYSTRNQQFKLLAGKNKVYHQVAIDEDMLLQNDLTFWEAETSSLIIKETGYYELSGSFHFNPNTTLLGYSRAGINFLICKNNKGLLDIIAGKRHTFYKENSNQYSTIEIMPAVAHFNQGDKLIICLNAGLLEKSLLSAKIGTSTKDYAPYSYKLKLIKL